MMLSKLSTDALALLAADGKSKHTIAAYEICFRYFLAHVTTTLKLTDDVKNFTKENVMSFKVALHQHNANPNTIRARLSSLSFLGKYATDRSDRRGKPLVVTSPVQGVARPKRQRPPEKWLQSAELAAFMDVKRPPRVDIVRTLLIDLALRVSEFCALSWKDLSKRQGIGSCPRQSKAGARCDYHSRPMSR